MNKKMKLGVLAALWLSVGLTKVQATEVKLNDVVKRFSFSGDYRLRQENFDKNNNVATTFDRSRQRYRLRLVTEFELPQNVIAKMRFSTGDTDPTSSNQSMDNLSQRPFLGIDQAFLTWSPLQEFSLVGGRMQNPFWRTYSSELVWDDDFSPEGAAQKVKLSLFGRGRFFFNSLQMVADEDNGMSDDQWMLGEQVGVEIPMFSQSRFQAAGAYHYWKDANKSTFGNVAFLEGNRRTTQAAATPGALQNAFGVAEATLEFATWAGPWPLSLQGSYINNTRAMDTLAGAAVPKENMGYEVGAILGQAKLDKSWEAAYFYKYVQTDATVADVADSDFGDGGTNRKGSIFWLAYNPFEWLQFKGKAFVTQVAHENIADFRKDPASTGQAVPAGNDSIKRVQLDVSVKF